MPTIYDNIGMKFADGLTSHISTAKRVDYCVGYFNIRGWKTVCDEIDLLEGMDIYENNQIKRRYCRLLVGMVKTPYTIFLQRKRWRRDYNTAEKTYF